MPVPDGLKVRLLAAKDQHGNPILGRDGRPSPGNHGPIGEVVYLSYSAAQDLIKAGCAEAV